MGLDGLRWDRSVASLSVNAPCDRRMDLLGQVEPDLGLSDLRFVDVDSCLLRQEVVGNGDSGGFSGWLSAKSLAHDSLSPVSFLKAQPSMAIFLPVMLTVSAINHHGEGTYVLKRVSTTFRENRSFWCSFISTTARQYLATSGK